MNDIYIYIIWFTYGSFVPYFIFRVVCGEFFGDEDPCLQGRFGGCALWLPIAWRRGAVHGPVGLPFEAGRESGSGLTADFGVLFVPWVNW